MRITQKELRRIITEETDSLRPKQDLKEHQLMTEMAGAIVPLVLNLLKNPQVIQMLGQLLLPVITGAMGGAGGAPGGGSAASTGTGGAIGGGGGASLSATEEE